MNQQKIKRIWNAVTTGLLALVVLLAMLLWGARLVGLNVFVVQSGSMDPVYPTGSVVYVRRVDPEKLKVGDVITFRINETTRATHRIIEVTEMDGEVAFRTKGDANEHADNGLVPPSGIVGKVLFGIPGLGYLTVYIQNPPGIYIAISVAAFIMLLMVIPELIFNDRKSRENNKEEKL